MIELNFPVNPDEHGVVDGLELASYLIYTAAEFTLPYVQGCPACLDVAFEKIANAVLKRAHYDIENNDQRGACFVIGLEGEERLVAIRAHLQDRLQSTKALLEGVNEDHH